MILFLEDWRRYPNATVHLGTTNASFIEFAAKLKKTNVKNYLFVLALHNPKLLDVDAHSKTLTLEEKMMIAREIKENPWYYFREIARAPATSGGLEDTPFLANPGSIAVIWAFFAEIADILLHEQIRQTGKSFTSRHIIRGLLSYWTNNANIGLFTKDNALRMETIEEVKSIEEALPDWLRFTSRKDANNSQTVTCIRNSNKLVTAVAQKSEIAANNVLRGHTIPVVFMDEPSFASNIGKSLPAILASTGAARKAARAVGAPVATLLTTTSGDPSNKSGAYVYNKIYRAGAKFNLKYYDCYGKKEAVELVKKHSSGDKRILILSFNHKELGMSEEEFKQRLRESGAEGTEAERDFFLKWVADGSTKPLDTKVLRVVEESLMTPLYTEVTDTGHIIEWYIPEDEVRSMKKRALVAGMDTSDLLGADALDIVILDPISGAVLGRGHYSTGLLDDVSELVVSLATRFEKLVFIPEKRSSAMGIMDTAAKMFIDMDINPFTRIFNKAVQHADRHELERLSKLKYDELKNTYIKHKKDFGYTTSGAGEHSRINLYGRLEDNLRYLGSTIRCKILIGQITGLINKNGRIDHGELGDDAVIAFMLAIYLLRQGENLEFYGLDTTLILSNVYQYNVDAIDSIKIHEENLEKEGMYKEIGRFLKLLEESVDAFEEEAVKKRIYKLERELGDIEGRKPLNITNRINSILNNKKAA